MAERTEKNALGAILALIGGIITIGVTIFLFFTIYEGIVYYNLFVRDPPHECRATIGYFLPIFADIGIIGGTFLVIGAFGFGLGPQ